MPELPEVETVRRTLRSALRGTTLGKPDLRRPDIVEGPATPRALLGGAEVADVIRHGKQFAIVSRDGRALCIHLGMSGRFEVAREGEPEPKHTHIAWTVRGKAKGSMRLLFSDPRRFGGVWTFASVERLRVNRWSLLGPDALTASADQLAALFKESRRGVKAALLDQSCIAGLGNIYTDESLHAAGIHPAAPASGLARARVDRLHEAIVRTLRSAIEARGSTLSDGQYRDGNGERGGFQLRHRVYARSGQPCLVCGARLRSAAVAGRTTTWCPACQPRRAPRGGFAASLSNGSQRVIPEMLTM